jgi:DNA mismatch endonuclease (patch repair protein)
MDKLTAAARSRNMSRIRSSNTKPELLVRRLAHRLGYRFRLHRRDLPGAPDLVFPSRRKVIFVHGCYWHQHPGCREGRPPSSNQSYWLPKLRRTQERDDAALRDLTDTGWESLVLWECELANDRAVERTIRNFLGRR